VACAAPGRATPWLALRIPLVLVAAKLHGLYVRDELVIRKGTVEELPALLQLAGSFTIVTWVCDALVLRGTLTSTRGRSSPASGSCCCSPATRRAGWPAARPPKDVRIVVRTLSFMVARRGI
jgi:hypothetical protein